jgi:hypothetical protein
MRVSYFKIARVVEMCMMFHNVCIDRNVTAFRRSRCRRWEDHGVPNLNLNEQFIEGTGRVIDTCIPKQNMTQGRRRDLELSHRREMICKALFDMKLSRPQYSRYGKSTQAQYQFDYDDVN